MGWNKIKEIQKWNSRRIKTQRKKDKKKKNEKNSNCSKLSFFLNIISIINPYYYFLISSLNVNGLFFYSSLN